MPPEKSSTTNAQTAEQRLARAVAEERTRLLRRHRHRLPSDELDDCLSQAATKLVVRARREPFKSGWHPVLALEQRFVARISDRRRALAGRSPRERLFRSAVAVDNDGNEEISWIAEPGASLDEQILHRDELRGSSSSSLIWRTTSDSWRPSACSAAAIQTRGGFGTAGRWRSSRRPRPAPVRRLRRCEPSTTQASGASGLLRSCTRW